MCSSMFKMLGLHRRTVAKYQLVRNNNKCFKPDLARLTNGGLAQLARAPALQAGGQRFESVILHIDLTCLVKSSDL